MTREEAEKFKLEMFNLKQEFQGGFWAGSEVRRGIEMLADTVVGFNDRLVAIEEKLKVE